MTYPHTIKRLTYGLTLAGLLAFSGTGLAQSKAVETLDQTHSQPTQASVVDPHAMADQLASEVTAYNNADQTNHGLQPAGETQSLSQPESRMARELSREIKAYYGNAPFKTASQSRALSDRNVPQATPIADRLASEITTYNRTNGARIN